MPYSGECESVFADRPKNTNTGQQQNALFRGYLCTQIRIAICKSVVYKSFCKFEVKVL